MSMALREPSGWNGKDLRLEHNYVHDKMDYRSSQVRDLRDAVNEWMAEDQNDENEFRRENLRIINAIVDRIEALEAKMVDNSPKGGYSLGSIVLGEKFTGEIKIK